MGCFCHGFIRCSTVQCPLRLEKATVLKSFVSTRDLEALIEQGKAVLQDGVLTYVADGKKFKAEAAVSVQQVLDGRDVQGLINKVVTQTELQKMNAEHYGDSLVVGETAYNCLEGFATTPVIVPSVARPSGAPLPPPKPVGLVTPKPADKETATKSSEEVDETALLSEFLLKHLDS